MLYGSELYAWEEGVKGYETVVHQFFKRFIGLQQGTSGLAIELILGRESIKNRAIRRALIYWRKSVDKNSEYLVKEAMNEQYRDLEISNKNWLYNVKNELNVLGLGYLWESPRRLGIKKFKKIITRRMRDIELQKKRGILEVMTSGRLLCEMHNNVGMMSLFSKLQKNDLRRFYVKILLNQFEDLIRRDMGEKFCIECSQLIEGNVANHRILVCENLEKPRKTLEKLKWFEEISKLSPEYKITTKLILKAFERPGIYSMVKLLKKETAVPIE